MEAVLQAASCTTVDSDLGVVAVLYEVAGTLAAAPVLFSSVLDTVADFVAVLDMVVLDEEEVDVNLQAVVVQMEVAAVHL